MSLRGAVSSNVLDLCKLGVFHDLPCRIARIRSQDHRCASGYLVGDLFGMDVVIVPLIQRRGDCCELRGLSEQYFAL